MNAIANMIGLSMLSAAFFAVGTAIWSEYSFERWHTTRNTVSILLGLASLITVALVIYRGLTA
jgi:hypothetical protein